MAHERAVEFEQYAKWFSLPVLDRLYKGEEGPVHLKTKTDFANHFGVDTSTLWHWEQETEFKKKVAEYQLEMVREGLGGVLMALREKAEISKDPRSIEIYLKYVDKWFDTQQEIKSASSADDIFDSNEFLAFFAQKLADRPELKPAGLDANQFLKIVRDILGR